MISIRSLESPEEEEPWHALFMASIPKVIETTMSVTMVGSAASLGERPPKQRNIVSTFWDKYKEHDTY